MTNPVAADASTRAEKEQTLKPKRSSGLRIIAGTVAWAVFAILIASVVIFFALNTLPGDPAVILGGLDASPEQLQLIRQENGWDRPIIVQYFDWFTGVLTGDFGTSPFTGMSVTDQLVIKLQVTLPLAIASLALALVIALVLGIYAGARAEFAGGKVVSWVSQIGIAVPSFIVGMLLVMYVAAPLNLPATGFPRQGWDQPGQAIRSLILPTVTLAIPQAAALTRYVRSTIIEQRAQDYPRTARAQGLSRFQTLMTHVLRNSWLPLLGVLALDAAALLMGTVVVEQVFALPGVGRHLVSSVTNRDITTVQGFLMVLSSTVIVIMMISNLLARLLDPRVRVR